MFVMKKRGSGGLVGKNMSSYSNPLYDMGGQPTAEETDDATQESNSSGYMDLEGGGEPAQMGGPEGSAGYMDVAPENEETEA